MHEWARFLKTHEDLTRRFFLRLGVGSAAAVAVWPRDVPADASEPDLANPEPADPQLAAAIAALEPYFTLADKFQDVSRGTPLPHSLPDDKKAAVGLTRDTWRLEVRSDPEHPAKIHHPLTKADGTALDFPALLKLGEKHVVRFAKVMTCLNIGCPLGMGVWEGVPLRQIIALAKPRDDLRRVFFYGYHNDDPAQMFRSSLPIGRVLEDPFDLPPVIVCYKLNGEWLSSTRGGPVRMVVPEDYGFRSVKWLSHVVLTNLAHANDTYADGNNDIDSPLKTFAATLSVPRGIKAGQKLPVTGYVQVGMGGLSKVQTWLHPDSQPLREGDPHFATAAWGDAKILSPPRDWGGGLPDGKVPTGTLGFDAASGAPTTWPMRLCKAHWATLLPGVPAGQYTLRCRTIDAKGIAQPLPRPLRKSGHAAIEQVAIVVKG